MKKWIVGILILMVLSWYAVTASAVTLEWDANIDDTLSYRVYYKTSGEYVDFEETTLTTHTLNLLDGDWLFVVTALDGHGNESGYSNEVGTEVDTIPPMIPGMLRIVP